jgi:hypothetical protein
MGSMTRDQFITHVRNARSYTTKRRDVEFSTLASAPLKKPLKTKARTTLMA